MPYGHYQPTPGQIISWLPKDATPEQQDSAVQAHTKPREIHWSQCPDTLHLPGHSIGKKVTEAHLPTYYKESYFSDKPCYHPELVGKRQGEAGDPMPYTIASDNFMTSLLLICLIGSAMAISSSSDFFARRLKMLFHPRPSEASLFTQTSNEVRIQLAMVMEACLLLAVLFIYYLNYRVANTFAIGQYEMIAMFTGVFASYFAIKFILQSTVGWVFFSKEQNRQWNGSSLFLNACLGLLLLPMSLVQSFFSLDIKISVIYSLSVIGIYEIMSFYKLHRIFFLPKGAYPGFILYLCTLEITPAILVWNALTVISENLKINL